MAQLAEDSGRKQEALQLYEEVLELESSNNLFEKSF